MLIDISKHCWIKGKLIPFLDALKFKKEWTIVAGDCKRQSAVVEYGKKEVSLRGRSRGYLEMRCVFGVIFRVYY